MITETFHAKINIKGKRSTSRAYRRVVITGKDRAAFAAVLRNDAAAARGKGDVHHATYLESQAAYCERVKRFSVNIPIEST